MSNRSLNYRFMAITPEDYYGTTQSRPMSSTSASLAGGRRFNHVPARFRTQSGALNRVHINAIKRSKNNENNDNKKKNKLSDVTKAANTRLVPRKATPTPSRNVRDRMKHPRLVGADVYVARISNCGPAPMRRDSAANMSASVVREEQRRESISSSTSAESLHDELTCSKGFLAAPPTSRKNAESENVSLRRALESRPCYRCVSYMHLVGIKRVFWTNTNGDWEGAKVRDLIDLMDRGEHSDGIDNALERVFVTKHGC